jgi:hypothetical protein
MGFACFDVFQVNASVPDVRVGQCDNLATVTRVGQDFLVARQRGIEYHFANSVPSGADGNTPEDRSILQRKDSNQVVIKGSL